jgi:hypothetical protein
MPSRVVANPAPRLADTPNVRASALSAATTPVLNAWFRGE